MNYQLRIKPLLDIVSSNSRLSLLATLATISVPWLVNNYCLYVALGKAGVARTPLLWLYTLLLKPFERETLGTIVYDQDPNKEAWLNPSIIPERRGDRPTTGWHSIPHRQTNRFPSKEAQQRSVATMMKHAHSNPTLVHVMPSPHEGAQDALVIHPGVPSPHKVAEYSLREIVHIHQHRDWSLHAALAPQDCKVVIERGWGQRHPLSGQILLPKEYLMIYAPRDDEELAVVEQIIVASIGYMTGSRNVL